MREMGLDSSDDLTVALVRFGIFAFLKDVGNAITGSISAQLIVPYEYVREYGLGRYEWIASSCGMCMFACSLTMVVLFFE